MTTTLTTTTLTRFGSLLLALLASASGASALEPRAVERKQSGHDPQLGFEWELQRLELQQLGNTAVQRRVNLALKEYCDAAKRDFIADISGQDRSPQMSHGLWIGMSQGVLNRSLLSVNVSISIYYAGAAHPNNGVDVLTFDLRTGRQLPRARLFKPGDEVLEKVAALVDAKLKASDEYRGDGEYLLETVTADKLGSVLVEEEGLTFIFGGYEIGPHAVGTPVATLSYAELRDLIDRTILASVLPRPAVLPRRPTTGLTTVVEPAR